MKRNIFWLLLTLIITPIQAQNALSQFFDQSNQFFNTYVTSGKVRYAALANAGAPLNQLIDQVASMQLETADENEKKAFYINAYNLHAIDLVVSNYPLESVQHLKGFFDRKKIELAGQSLTLNALEKEIIFNHFPDPRIHFALVCAAAGCPKLPAFAFMPKQLDQQLDTVTENAINDTYFTRVNNARRVVYLSQIFQWYRDDFLKEAADLLEYVNKYRYQEIPSNFEVRFYEYDWRLNDI